MMAGLCGIVWSFAQKLWRRIYGGSKGNASGAQWPVSASVDSPGAKMQQVLRTMYGSEL